MIFNGCFMLFVQIAEKTSRSIFFKACNNIDRCTVVQTEERGPIFLQTAGVNFETFWDLEEDLDVRRINSNDICAMLKTYGVEIATATIKNEVNKVFKHYGRTVDNRHLNMIADFMTFDGGYRPMNRIGTGEHCTSPLWKRLLMGRLTPLSAPQQASACHQGRSYAETKLGSAPPGWLISPVHKQ
jgi:DNA-directed RNA polymerase I subunit RPA1